MTPVTGPSLDQYLIVIGFLIVIFIGFYFFKKNKHLISSKLHNERRMKVSEVTMLGQGDRALILNLDKKDFLFISGKNSGALLTEIKSSRNNQFNNLEVKKIIEKRISDDQVK